MSENRDFMIERLERQLKEKDAELNDIKSTLRDSILREIRTDLKSDFDINNRIISLEHKIQALTSNLNGVMDELLDQKSMIRSLSELAIPKQKKEEVKSPATIGTIVEKALDKSSAYTERPQEPTRNYPAPPTPTNARNYAHPQATANRSNVSVRSVPGAGAEQYAPRATGTRMLVRDDDTRTEPVQIRKPEKETEYIIAETDEERNKRVTYNAQRTSGEYIIADEKKDSRYRKGNEEYEVEERDHEDAVITITRRR